MPLKLKPKEFKSSIPKEIEEIFRRKAMEKYGYSKGAVSKAL